jgi:hypothetical protein
MSEGSPGTGPTITAAAVVPGHDGLAEVAVTVRYPNGAIRSLSLPYDDVAGALDTAGVCSLDQLVGRPWTALAHASTLAALTPRRALTPIPQGAP